MTKHYASTGTDSGSYEDGKWYDFVVKGIEMDPDGQYGSQFKFILTRGIDSQDDSDFWLWCSMKLGKHQGRVSNLRGVANALFGKPEDTEIEWVDDETFEVKYEGEDEPKRLKAGLVMRARGEFLDGKYKLTRFAKAETRTAASVA